MKTKNGKANSKDFYYPLCSILTGFYYPWECYGGWLNWFKHNWEFEDKDNKKIWIGSRILGITIIRIVWTCSERQAKNIHYKTEDIFINSLNKFLSSNPILDVSKKSRQKIYKNKTLSGESIK